MSDSLAAGRNCLILTVLWTLPRLLRWQLTRRSCLVIGFTQGKSLSTTSTRNSPSRSRLPTRRGATAAEWSSTAFRRIGVVRQNNDGSWRLVLRQDANDSDTRYKDKKKLATSEHRRISIMSCDLFSDGRVANESNRYLRSLNFLLPRLPKNEVEMRDGWSDAEENWGSWDTRYRITSKATRARHVSIEAVRRGQEQALFGCEYCNVAYFDVQRGIPDDADTTYKRTRHVRRRGMRLDSA